MPLLALNTNFAIAPPIAEPLLHELSRAVAQATNKPERYVMVKLCSNQAMLFGGSDQALAYLECKSIGLTANQAKTLSAMLTDLLTAALPLTAERIYIEFSACAPEFWGWNGSTFG